MFDSLFAKNHTMTAAAPNGTQRTPALLIALVASTMLAACAGTAAPESSRAASQSSSAVQGHDPASDLSGTWAFELEQSAVAEPLRRRCAAQSNGDAAKQAACWSEIRAEAKVEKIRFSKLEGGRATWTSFGHDDGREVIFVELPIELAPDGPGHVLAKVEGKASGEHAARFESAHIDAMRIEVLDARTIALDDPRKGRLVYSRE